MLDYRVPAILESSVRELAEKCGTQPTKLIRALLTLAVERPELVVIHLTLDRVNKQQESAFVSRSDLDTSTNKPLTDRDVALMLHNYGQKGRATLEKYRAKLIDERGEFVEARVVKMVRALAEAKWHDPTVSRGPRTTPPHTIVGRRFDSIIVLSIVDRHNPPDGSEQVLNLGGFHNWALCRCDCGNLFYHAVPSVQYARCGGKHRPRSTHHWEPNPEHECPLRPRRVTTMIGRVFNYLTVVGKGSAKGKVLVQCRCGAIKQVHATALYSGTTKSCGCWYRTRLGAKGNQQDAGQPTSATLPAVADIDDLD